MSENKIEVGDKVLLCLMPTEAEPQSHIKGEVLHIPCDTTDCWMIKTDGGTLYYVQHFECIIRDPLEEPDE